MSAGQILLALALAAGCLYSIVGYPHRYGALTGRSRLFRTVGLFLFNLLLGLVLLGTFLDFYYNTTRAVGSFRFIMYFLACLFLALTLLCLALLDWLESLVVYRREQRNLVRQMVQDEAEETRKAQKPNGDDAKPDDAP